jgi:predicted MFS family arabinose efflux permease
MPGGAVVDLADLVRSTFLTDWNIEMKQNRFVLVFLVALIVIAISCGLAWLGGYNFDHRGPDVAFWGVETLLVVALYFS